MGFNTHQWYLQGLKKVGAANTFIGGVASVINTPELLAAKFQNYPDGSTFSAANIQNFTIIGDDIECYIGVDYDMSGSFYQSQITYYLDEDNFCKYISGTFRYAIKLSNIKFNGVLGISSISTIKGCKSLKKVEFPSCTNITRDAFYLSYIERYYLPRCVQYGVGTGSDQVFFGASKNSKIYADPSMATINGGVEEGDIDYLRNTLTATVVYVDNFTAPNPITNLSTGSVGGSYIQLLFTPPTGSTNALDGTYDVIVNGKYNNTINGSGGYAINLQINTSYNIEVKPVDIYYNKSTSNIVTQATNATYSVDTAALVSYYKMEGNVLDSLGVNNGTPTDITYASGVVGQTAVFNGTTSRIITTNDASLQLNTGSVVAVLNSTAAGSGYRGIVIKQHAFGLFLEAGVLITYSWGTATGITSGARSTGINVNDGINHVLALTFQLGVVNGTKIYIDGDLVLTTSVALNNQTKAFVIGAGTPDSIIQQINAQIDEVPIFNKILNAAEVSEINAKLNSGQSLI